MENNFINPPISDMGIEVLQLIFSSLQKGVPTNVVFERPSEQINYRTLHCGWMAMSRGIRSSLREWVMIPTVSEARFLLENVKIDDCIRNYHQFPLVFLPRMAIKVFRSRNDEEEDLVVGEPNFNVDRYPFSAHMYEHAYIRHLLSSEFNSPQGEALASFQRIQVSLTPQPNPPDYPISGVSLTPPPLHELDCMRVYVNDHLPHSRKRWEEVLRCEGIEGYGDDLLRPLL